LQIADTQVTFGSSQAQIISGDSSGILVLTPPSIAGAGNTEIDVSYKGSPVAAIQETVTDAAPALFADTSGQASATNQDGTVNSATNPASHGSIVSIYGAGFGLSPSQVIMTIAGYTADVSYAGPVAGYPGLFQVNARVPSGYLGAGNLNVVLTVGQASTQPGVTLWISP
jgi:uncharacterized protein (TIGR03437 family)